MISLLILIAISEFIAEIILIRGINLLLNSLPSYEIILEKLVSYIDAYFVLITIGITCTVALFTVFIVKYWALSRKINSVIKQNQEKHTNILS